MKIWHGENEVAMPGYSMMEGLVYDIIMFRPRLKPHLPSSQEMCGV
jgi:hypothetical protein